MVNFPTSLDTLTNPTGTNQVAVVDHAEQHSNVNDIVEALEAKVGVNGSAVTTSHDYKLGEVTGSDKAVGKSATQTLTNKTLTAPKIADTGSINDTNDNEFIKFNMTASAVNELAVTNGATGNAPRLSASGDDTNIDLSIRGKGTGKVSLGNANLKFPNADGSVGQFMITDGSGNLSFASNSTAPETISNLNRTSSSIPWVHSYSDELNGLCTICASGTTLTFHSTTITGGYQTRTITSDWADADSVTSAIVLGDYLYLMMLDGTTAYRVYRYDKTNLSAGGTLMTFSGQSLAYNSAEQRMTSNGTNFYFNHKAGNSANSYVVSKYTLSGTTLTYVSDITCGSTASDVQRFVSVDSSENIYGLNTSNRVVKKFNSSGTLQVTYGALPTYTGAVNTTPYCFNTAPYLQNSFDDVYAQRLYLMNRFYI